MVVLTGCVQRKRHLRGICALFTSLKGFLSMQSFFTGAFNSSTPFSHSSENAEDAIGLDVAEQDSIATASFQANAFHRSMILLFFIAWAAETD